jgi:hypothetical protein
MAYFDHVADCNIRHELRRSSYDEEDLAGLRRLIQSRTISGRGRSTRCQKDQAYNRPSLLGTK